jgi:hypothetical protein
MFLRNLLWADLGLILNSFLLKTKASVEYIGERYMDWHSPIAVQRGIWR